MSFTAFVTTEYAFADRTPNLFKWREKMVWKKNESIQFWLISNCFRTHLTTTNWFLSRYLHLLEWAPFLLNWVLTGERNFCRWKYDKNDAVQTNTLKTLNMQMEHKQNALHKTFITSVFTQYWLLYRYHSSTPPKIIANLFGVPDLTHKSVEYDLKSAHFTSRQLKHILTMIFELSNVHISSNVEQNCDFIC